jgi:hypothetical protein
VSLDLLEIAGPEPEPATGKPEPSERQTRARGRAGDDLGSSRSSRDDDVPS